MVNNLEFAWVYICIDSGIVADTKVFVKKNDALLYFDSVAKEYDRSELLDFEKDEETGNCYFLVPDSGHRDIEVMVNRTSISYT